MSELRQAQKKALVLKKYREEPIISTVLKSGLQGIKLMRFSEVVQENRKLIQAFKQPEPKNWFMRFLDKARRNLYDPNNEIMVAILKNLNYNRIKNTVIEADYDTIY